jgi:hypothetical protein
LCSLSRWLLFAWIPGDQAKYRIDFEVIIEGLFTEWSERQARRFGKDVSAVERKTSEAGTLDAA